MGVLGAARMSAPVLTAAAAGLASCEACGLLTRPARPPRLSRCPRCRAQIAVRKPASLVRCGLFLVMAYALYVPANLLPVMYSEQLFRTRADTVMSGVVLLWLTGAWPLALIVFIASIVVPLAKMLVLTYLVVSVQAGSRMAFAARVRMYRVVRFIGRWSMLDIFVAAVLSAAVQFKSIAAVRPGAGAIAFAGVVLLTLFAAQAFDPRLIWDSSPERHGRA
jgi:paraquat-inducible protein A